MKFWGGIIALELALLSVSFQAPALQCKEVFSKIAVITQSSQAYYTLSEQIAIRNLAQAPYSKVLKFGYESEFTLDQYASGLLDFYHPDPSFSISSVQWTQLKNQTLGTDGRVVWIKENQAQIFSEVRKPGQMVLTPEGKKKLPDLPEQLIIDYTGNLEIILKPFDSFEAWKASSEEIAKQIGNGSLQSTVGIPAPLFWQKVAKHDANSAIGFLQFMADFDSILKLQSGYEKYVKEGLDRAYAGAFAHPFLGPLTHLKRQQMNVFLALESTGASLTKEQKEFVSYADNSWKYSGSTVYRPDIAKGYVVFEVRDAHSNLKHLEAQIQRLVYFMGQGITSFQKHAQINAFDSVKDFDRFPPQIKSFLETIFPAKFIDPRVEYSAEELLANEVFRNFAYPMRDWKFVLTQFGQATSSVTQLGRARLAYLERLKVLQERYDSRQINVESARNQVQIALAQFINESSLFSIYMRQYQSHVETQNEQSLKKAN